MTTLAHNPDEYACPHCAETIIMGAALCRFCGHGISPKIFRLCPHCAEMIRKDASFCRYCQSDIEQHHYDDRPLRLASRSIPGNTSDYVPDNERVANCKKIIMKQLTHELKGMSLKDNLTGDVQGKIRERIRELVNHELTPLTMMEKGMVLQGVLDEIFGFGPIGPLLRMPAMRELFVLDFDQIYIKGTGELWERQLSNAKFENKEHYLKIVNRILETHKMEISKENPIASFTLASGTLVIVTRKRESESPTLILRMAT